MSEQGCGFLIIIGMLTAGLLWFFAITVPACDKKVDQGIYRNKLICIMDRS